MPTCLPCIPPRLQDCVARCVPFWESHIAPALAAGRRVLVAAHGNSLRGLVKHLDDISDQVGPWAAEGEGRNPVICGWDELSCAVGWGKTRLACAQQPELATPCIARAGFPLAGLAKTTLQRPTPHTPAPAHQTHHDGPFTYPQDIMKLEIPVGAPLVYELDEQLSPVRRYYLGAGLVAAPPLGVALLLPSGCDEGAEGDGGGQEGKGKEVAAAARGAMQALAKVGCGKSRGTYE